MPKIFNREIPNWMIGLGVVVLGGLVYSGFGGDDGPAKLSSTTKKPATKQSTSTIYTPDDMTGHFASFTETPKNAFLPLISKALPTPTAVNNPNGFNAAWANGEAGWGFTGYVVFDGKPQALLENSSTGEGSYVSTGEHWKASTIGKITPDEIVLSTSTGPHTVKLGEGGERKGGKDTTPAPAPAVLPANPATALQGPIGNNPAMAQMNGMQDPNAVQMDPNGQGAQQMYQNRGRRRFGRGRGN